MKIRLSFLAVLLPLALHAQPSPKPADPTAIAPSTEPCQIANSGPHERVWQRPVVDAQGVTSAQAYTELATGLNFWNPATRNWEPSRELFQITKDGFAVATNGQHKTIIAPDVAAPDGAIDYLGPDGQRLLSNPRALVYRDVASGKSVIIAQVTNCVGEMSSPNVVIFPTAFDSVKAAISYTYTKAGFEQDVILYRRLPSPSDLDAEFSPDSTVLEIWTEFLVAPNPAVSFGASASDQTLDFGQTRMGRGVAYFQNATELQSVPLEKTWQDIDSRHFLVESVSYSKIKPLLDKLQASAAPAKKSETARLAFPNRQKLVTAALSKRSSSRLIASIRRTTELHEPGLVLDYQTLNTSQTNLTLQSTTTYFVSAPVNVTAAGGSPALTIEGLSVVKFTNDPAARLSVSGPILCKTGPYRMAILTSMSDDSVGNPISGSTGSPTNFNGATYISSSIFGSNSYTNSYRYLRFAFAGRALDLIDDSHSDIWHCQFVSCGVAISWCDDCSGAFYGIHNALFAQCGTLNGYGGGGFKGEHITVDGGNLGACSCGNFTNSILIGITNLLYGTLEHCVTNSSSAGFFTSAGAGNYYLANGSTNRNAGTTNINSTLLSDIKQRTTYPPIVYSNVTWSASTTLSPQSQRDTDTPDLGYHYAPIDFITHMVQITNCSWTLAPGTAVACYNWTGIWIQEGGSITCIGTPLDPNWLVGYQCVQEQPLALGGSTASWSVNAYHTGSPAPTGAFRFTRIVTSPGGGNQFYNSSWSFGTLLLQDSEVWGGVNKFDGAPK